MDNENVNNGRDPSDSTAYSAMWCYREGETSRAVAKTTLPTGRARRRERSERAERTGKGRRSERAPTTVGVFTSGASEGS